MPPTIGSEAGADKYSIGFPKSGLKSLDDLGDGVNEFVFGVETIVHFLLEIVEVDLEVAKTLFVVL